MENKWNYELNWISNFRNGFVELDWTSNFREFGKFDWTSNLSRNYNLSQSPNPDWTANLS